jgi:hypothetical protein
MEGKRHCLKAFDDIENKKVNLEQHVKKIWIEHVRIKSEELNECTKIGNIPSSSKNSHVYECNFMIWSNIDQFIVDLKIIGNDIGNKWNSA